MTKTEKLKQLGYTYDNEKYQWVRIRYEYSCIMVIDLIHYNYWLKVRNVYVKDQLKMVLKIFKQLKKDFEEVLECEDDEQ